MTSIRSESSFIQKIPDDILLEIVSPQLDLKTTGAVARVCKQSYGFFQAQLTVNTLLQQIARGEEEEAKKILAAHPALLMKRGTATDYCGNIIEDVTPFQLAYGADDDDMCKMMLRYVDKLPNGREEITKQIKERFPEAKEEKSYNFSALEAAITTNTDVEETIEQFREHFKPRIIKHGKHFKVQAYMDAIQVYINNYDTWLVKQSSLFWRQVIGYLQRMLPTCYAQAFCHGLSKVTDKNQNLRRSLKLCDDTFFYPEDPLSRSGLGFDYGVCMALAATRAFLVGVPKLDLFKSYAEQKQEYCRIYIMFNNQLKNRNGR